MMINEYLKSIWIILPITLATMLLEALRIKIVPRADQTSFAGLMSGYLIAGLGFGWLAILVFNWINNRWPENAGLIYFWLAIGAAVALTLLAIMMRFVFKSPMLDVMTWTAMNFIWGFGYGWFLPNILNNLQSTV